jgi:hypothetical protein
MTVLGNPKRPLRISYQQIQAIASQSVELPLLRQVGPVHLVFRKNPNTNGQCQAKSQ